MESVSIDKAIWPGRPDGFAEFRRGMRASFPVVLGFLPFGLVLGSQAAQRGLSRAEVALMTGLNFGGGSEFAAIALWNSPPSILLIAAITFLVNSRHLLMGAALAPALQNLPRNKVFTALFFMCDESWAYALADWQRQQQCKPRLSLPYYWGVAIPLYISWISSTALGASIGAVLGDVERFGLHMAFPAVFLVLMRGMWKGLRFALPWIVSLIAAAATYLLVPGPWYVLTGAVCGVTAGYWQVPVTNAEKGTSCRG